MGNCVKKDLDFQEVLSVNFGGGRLTEFLKMIHEDKISVANAKIVMMRVIDGEGDCPQAIAQKLGFLGAALTQADVDSAVEKVLSENQDIVKKILKTGKSGPIMALVGKVMQALNRRGDPLVVKNTVTEAIEKLK